MRAPIRASASLFVALSCAVVLTSCEGEQGPAGPAGEDAAFTITTVRFTGAEAGISGSASYYNIDVPQITQDVLDDGSVLVYLNNSVDSEADDTWILMPFNALSGTDVCSFSCAYRIEEVMLLFATTAVEWPYSPMTWYHFKIVTLLGSLSSTVDPGNFKEVEDYCLRSQGASR